MTPPLSDSATQTGQTPAPHYSSQLGSSEAISTSVKVSRHSPVEVITHLGAAQCTRTHGTRLETPVLGRRHLIGRVLGGRWFGRRHGTHFGSFVDWLGAREESPWRRPDDLSCQHRSGLEDVERLRRGRRKLGGLVSAVANELVHQTLQQGNIFVVSLAVADLVVALYPYPLVLTAIFHRGWNLGSTHCQISGFLMGVSVVGSIFNITGIAVNRYCYICHSLKYDKLFSDKNSACYVLLIWALTVLAIIPNLFVGSLQYDARVYSCTFEQSASSAYTIAVVFFHFILPIMVVTYCYLRIWVLVIQVRRRVKPDNRPKLTPHDVRNFVTMFVVFVLFAVCWAPLNFIGLAVAVAPERLAPLIPEWLFVASYFMAYFNSCLNAIVYGVLNQNFRREYKRIVVSVCTARIFFPESSNEAQERLKSKPSPLMTNNNQVKVDSV
ncbi:hypothetical protein SRHO_G00246820 [Serrasalmus rhombeus]